MEEDLCLKMVIFTGELSAFFSWHHRQTFWWGGFTFGQPNRLYIWDPEKNAGGKFFKPPNPQLRIAAGRRGKKFGWSKKNGHGRKWGIFGTISANLKNQTQIFFTIMVKFVFSLYCWPTHTFGEDVSMPAVRERSMALSMLEQSWDQAHHKRSQLEATTILMITVILTGDKL